MPDDDLERAMISIGEKLEANGVARGAVAEFTTMLRVHAEECAVLEDERDAALLDLDKALAAIERVRALHSPSSDERREAGWKCDECDAYIDPCETLFALEGDVETAAP